MIPTIHLIDDDESFLRSMSRRLKAHGYYVSTHESVTNFFEMRDPESPGCVLADLQMPRRDGFDLQETLTKSANPLPVVFVTGKGDIPTSVRAMRKGAEDFLTKRVPTAALIEAIERAISRDVRERAARVRNMEARRMVTQLTGRELQMLLGIVTGMQNREMAEKYAMSERTVKFYRTVLTRRLNMTAAAELTRLVLDAGISTEELTEMTAKAPPGPRQT